MAASEGWARSARGSRGDLGPAVSATSGRTDSGEGAVGRLPDLVHDLVAELPLSSALERVASAAATATEADAHLLAIRTGTQDRVRSEGIDRAVAETIARRLLEEGPRGATSLSKVRNHHLLAPVDAGEGPVGWLVMFREREAFGPAAAVELRRLGEVIGAGLVVSDALARARRASAVSDALLHLGRELAHERDETVIAQRVAEAMPTVVGAERASVLLWNDEGRCLETVSAVGFGEQTEQALRFTIPLGATPALDRMITDTRPRRFDRSTSDPFVAASIEAFGHAAVSVAAIVADEEMLGIVLALHREEGDDATSRDELGALESIADQAAISISRRRLLAAALHAATHDHLTGLADRRLFEERVRLAIQDRRHAGRAAVCFLDLDDFKAVNDTHGHEAGDRLLAEIATRLHGQVRSSDTVARISGDEFGVLLPGVEDRRVAERIVQDLARAAAAPCSTQGLTLQVGISVGVAFAPDDGGDPRALLRAADEAMYRAKRAGDVVRFATPANGHRTT